MTLCPVMSRPFFYQGKTRLLEVECRQEDCEWWNEPFRGCANASTCEDVDSGPCSLTTCPKCVLTPRQKGWCKMVEHD